VEIDANSVRAIAQYPAATRASLSISQLSVAAALVDNARRITSIACKEAIQRRTLYDKSGEGTTT
jgi:hypothetical protein